MKTIVCYGDSNTWGYMPKVQRPTETWANRYPWGVRWTSVLQEKLGAGYRVEEEGVNGRTTAFDDPLAGFRNGLDAIDTTLLAKFPVDMVVLMLGTNDTKEFLGMPAWAIAKGAQLLIERIQNGGYAHDGGAPEILLVAPIKLNNAITEGWLAEEFGPSSLDKDAQLARYYLKVAEETGVHFFNAAEFIEADPADGVHMNDAGHAVMAEKIYEQVKNIIG